MIWLLLTFATVGTVLFMTDASHVIREVYITKRDEFRQINELVRTTGNHQVVCRSLKLIFQMMVFNFKQTLNHHIQPLDSGTYEVKCIIKGKIYKMIVIPHRGPFDVVHATDELDNNVTEELIPYLLSHKTQRVTPQLFGWDQVTIEFLDGREEIFGKQDVIVLTH